MNQNQLALFLWILPQRAPTLQKPSKIRRFGASEIIPTPQTKLWLKHFCICHLAPFVFDSSYYPQPTRSPTFGYHFAIGWRYQQCKTLCIVSQWRVTDKYVWCRFQQSKQAAFSSIYLVSLSILALYCVGDRPVTDLNTVPKVFIFGMPTSSAISCTW